MTIKTEEYILPSWCIGYLFNGDHSALNDEEIKLVDDFIDAELETSKSFHAIDCKELGFENTNDLDSYAGDCHKVTFQIN